MLSILGVILTALQGGSLLATHRYPQTVFYNEFFTAFVLAGVLAALSCQRRTMLRFSSFTLLFALVALWAVVSPLFFRGGDDSGLPSLCAYVGLAFGSFALIHSYHVTQAFRVVAWCAWGMFASALLQCAVSAFQLSGVAIPGVVMAKLMNAAYGNIAQENHFADLLWLGLVSNLYLWLRRELPNAVAFCGIVLFAIFSALSVSRAVWLYTAAFPLVVLAYGWRMPVETRARAWWGAGSIVAFSVASQIWLAFGGAQSALGVTSAIDRVSEGGSNGQRMFDWLIAWKTALAHPWAGVGPGMYSWQTALASIGLTPVSYVRIGENAHNTVLHFAAEFGLVFVLVALILIGMWLWRRWKEVPTLENMWALGILTVIGAHSMVEYPLWYTYFLVPAACAIGVVDAGDRGLPTVRFNARWLLIPVAIGAVVLAFTWRDYRRLESAYATLNANPSLDAATSARLDAAGASVGRYSLMASQAAILRMRAWRTDDLQRLPQIVQVCDDFLKLKPQYNSFSACLTAYTLSGRKADADQINEIVCGAFPPVHSRPFIEYARKLYDQRKWALPPQGRCG